MKATIILYTLVLILGVWCILLPQFIFTEEITRYWGIAQWGSYFAAQIFGLVISCVSTVVLYME